MVKFAIVRQVLKRAPYRFQYKISVHRKTFWCHLDRTRSRSTLSAEYKHLSTHQRNLKTDVSLIIIRMSSFSKFLFQIVFRPHKNENLALSNYSSFKRYFEKLCLCGGLVWTVGLSGEIKPLFQISPASCEQELTV